MPLHMQHLGAHEFLFTCSTGELMSSVYMQHWGACDVCLHAAMSVKSLHQISEKVACDKGLVWNRSQCYLPSQIFLSSIVSSLSKVHIFYGMRKCLINKSAFSLLVTCWHVASGKIIFTIYRKTTIIHLLTSIEEREIWLSPEKSVILLKHVLMFLIPCITSQISVFLQSIFSLSYSGAKGLLNMKMK